MNHAMDTRTFRLPDEQIRWLEKIGRAVGKNKSAVLRDFIHELMTKGEAICDDVHQRKGRAVRTTKAG